jgi:hypothetical protein
MDRRAAQPPRPRGKANALYFAAVDFVESFELRNKCLEESGKRRVEDPPSAGRPNPSLQSLADGFEIVGQLRLEVARQENVLDEGEDVVDMVGELDDEAAFLVRLRADGQAEIAKKLFGRLAFFLPMFEIRRALLETGEPDLRQDYGQDSLEQLVGVALAGLEDLVDLEHAVWGTQVLLTDDGDHEFGIDEMAVVILKSYLPSHFSLFPNGKRQDSSQFLA